MITKVFEQIWYLYKGIGTFLANAWAARAVVWEMLVYMGLAVIGASIATWILHNIWNIFYV